MSNNNKQPLNLSLPVFANGLGIPKIKRPDVTTQSDSDDGSTVGILLDRAERGKNRGYQRPQSICEVSRILRDDNESLFIPQLVSIGPIHSEDPKLQEFEGLKECYLNDLLNRCHDSTPKETLEACLLKVNDLIPKIRESYADVKNHIIHVYGFEAYLAMMMVMDGCFILEFCFKHDSGNWQLPNKMQTRRIAMDLILLENQVPFFVLQALFDCSMGKVSFTLSQVLDAYLAPYVKLFCSLLPEKISTTDVASDLPKKNSTTNVDSDSTTNVDSDSTHDHVLGYLHKRYQPVVAKSSNPIPAEASTVVYHSIVELDRSGINFKPHQEGDWSMTIEFQSHLFRCLPSWFWSRPTLLMPPLVIDDFTELILRNFIAYEQSSNQDRYWFTSYAHAMDMLIDTREDIAKLADSKVLFRKLGSNKEAAVMFNKLGRNIFVADFHYTEVFKQMDKYHNGFWPKNIARLKRVYFSNPWSIIALLAAFILFGLTVAQTIFTIKAA